MSDQNLVALATDVSYKILKWIGGGGFGQVFKVMRNGEVVACKQIETNDPDFALEEHRHMTLVRGGPNIAAVHDQVEWNPRTGILSFFMDYYRGKDLERLIQTLRAIQQQFTEVQIIEIAYQIAVALDYCHDRGILHQDMKPMNVLLETPWDPLANPDNVPNLFVTDFGIASHVQNLKTRITGHRGTPGYLAPYAAFSDKSDIYAFGCILYRLCSFNDPDRAAGLKPLEISPHYSLDLLSLVSSMISFDREDRPSAAQVKTQLESLIRASLPSGSIECRICHEVYLSKHSLRKHLKRSHHRIRDRDSVHEVHDDDVVVETAGPVFHVEDGPEWTIRGITDSDKENVSELSVDPTPCAVCLRNFNSKKRFFQHLYCQNHYRNHEYVLRRLPNPGAVASGRITKHKSASGHGFSIKGSAMACRS